MHTFRKNLKSARQRSPSGANDGAPMISPPSTTASALTTSAGSFVGEPDELSHLTTQFLDATEALKIIHAKTLKSIASTQGSIETDQFLADSLGDYSTKLSSNSGDAKLAKCFADLQNLLNFVQQLRNNMNSAIKGKFAIPMDEFVRRDMKEAKASRKKYDKAKSNLEAAQNKVKQATTKGKVNYVKVQEVEKERDACKEVFDQQTLETMKTLQAVNDRNEFETMEKLCDYFEEYQRFFRRGHQRMCQLEKTLKTYRIVVDQRKIAYRSGGGKVTDRVRVSPSTSEFVDIDESIWEKETDERRKLIMKIVADEHQYAKLMKSLLDNYEQPLLEDERYAPKIQRQDVLAMFNGIDELHSIHVQLHSDLKEQLNNYPYASIGKCFLQNIQSLEAYTQFVVNSSTKMDALERSEKESNTIKQFLTTSEEKDQSNLATLLALPCYRIVKYIRKLQTLFSLTDSGDEDYADLKEAIEALQTLQTSVDQGMEISQRLVHVLKVRNRVSGFDGELVERNRRFLKEGDLLTVTDPLQKKPEEHHFFLFNNLMMYCKKVSLLSALTQTAHKYKFIGIVPLGEAKLRDLPDNELIKCALEITWGGGNSMTLIAPTYEAKLEWKKDIHIVMGNLATDRVFGVSLEKLMQLPREQGRQIPSIMELTIEWLRSNNGVQREGLFRISGMMTEIENLKDRIDQGEAVDISAQADPHAVAGLLKLWIRELPEPLISEDLYDEFLETVLIDEDPTGQGKPSTDATLIALRAQKTKELVSKLPSFQRSCLHYLLKYLVEVSKCEQVNKMGPHNLAIVFGPNLLYRTKADPFDCSNYRSVYNILEFLLANYEAIFEEEGSASYILPSPRFGAPPLPPVVSSSPSSSPREGNSMEDFEESGGGLGRGRGRGVALPPGGAGRGRGRSSPSTGGSPTNPPLHASSPPSVGATTSGGAPRAWTSLPAPTAGSPNLAQPIIPPRSAKRTMSPRAASTYVPASGVTHPSASAAATAAVSNSVPGINRPMSSVGRNPELQQQLQRQLASSAGKPRRPPPMDVSAVGLTPTPIQGRPPPLPTHPKPSINGSTASAPARTAVPTPTAGATSSGSIPLGSGQPPLCAMCSQPIMGKGINALDKKWHTRCFVCAHCKQPFKGSYIPHEGQPYCTEDFTALFAKVCAGCGQTIVGGGFLQAVGRDWHPEHFVCCHCGGGLEGGFFDVGGRPACTKCSPQG